MVSIFCQDIQLPKYSATFAELHFFKVFLAFNGLIGKHIYKNISLQWAHTLSIKTWQGQAGLGLIIIFLDS